MVETDPRLLVKIDAVIVLLLTMTALLALLVAFVGDTLGIVAVLVVAIAGVFVWRRYVQTLNVFLRGGAGEGGD
jgi:hypothetical protein